MEPVLRDLSVEEWPSYFRGMASLWGGGLAEEPFITYQRRLAWSAEAAGRYRLLGLCDDGGKGRVLSAFKAYELAGTTGGTATALRVLGIGAVFTPPELRRRGHASAMLAAALEQHARSGFHAALLFSDIGASLYRRLGFALLESTECLIAADQLPKAVTARSATGGDEPVISGLLAAGRAQSGLQLARDGWILRFQLRRLRELARSRSVAEPEWGLLVDPRASLLGEPRGGRGAALVRLSRDAIDILDAGWTTTAARDSLFAAVRDCCQRARRDLVRLWPAHQLRDLFPASARQSALSMLAPLQPGVALPGEGGPAELALLDHI